MRLALTLAGLVALLALGLAGAAALSPSIDRRPPTAAELARERAELDRLAREQAQAAALQPLDTTIAALWRLVPLVAAVALLGGLGAYGAGLARAHVERARRYARPDAAGLLPVELADGYSARAALAGYHGARLAEAQRPQVPAHLVYHAPRHAPAALDLAAVLPGAEAAPPPALPGLTDLAALGWRPSPESILLGLAEGGERITVPAKALCHVALVGATGAGKSNALRLLLPQLQAIGARVCLADPHYAALDPESGDDWRPIADRLHMAPAVTAGEIGDLFAYLGDELARRLELRREGRPWGPPLFLALDELPVIADCVPGAVEGLGKLLREGRKVGLYSVGASQSMLVKVLGGDSSARECYRTAFYAGGDLRSAAALLDLPQREIAEGALGRGVAYLRSAATAPARLVRVPWASNEAVAQLLDLPQAPATGEAAPRPTPRPIGFVAPAAVPPAASPRPGHGRATDAPSDDAATAAGRATAPLDAEAARILAKFAAGATVGELAAELAGTNNPGDRRYKAARQRVEELLRRLAAEVASA
jgi:hypothetical protein